MPSPFPSLLRFTTQPPTIYHSKPTWTWRSGVLRDFDFWLLLEGSAQLTRNRETLEMLPGEALLLQPGDQVTATQDPMKPVSNFGVHFLPKCWNKGEARRWRELPLRLHCHELGFVRELAERCVHYYHEEPEAPHTAVSIFAFLLEYALFESARPPTHPGDNKIKRMISEIRNDPGREWKPPEMARRLGLSHSQFNRRFRSLAECSPLRFVIQQRIRSACRLLRESDLSLEEISDSLGYNDVFFFQRQFRNETGQTPSSLRSGASHRQQ